MTKKSSSPNKNKSGIVVKWGTNKASLLNLYNALVESTVKLQDFHTLYTIPKINDSSCFSSKEKKYHQDLASKQVKKTITILNKYAEQIYKIYTAMEKYSG